MYCTKKVTEHITWIGGNDRRLALFESVYPIPMGVSYNSYFVSDEKTMVLDTVDKSVSGQFFENIESVRNGRKMDYLVVNHMEPDHAAVIDEFVLRYPEVQIICNEKIAEMMKQFFTFDVDSRTIIVKEGDTISTGQHTFTFVMAPMVHWPEVMMTYEVTNKILFSADAFGTFGALNGQLFADEVDFDRDYLDEARRYYTNIVGKYATQVQAALQKAASIEINMICPLHGFVWRKNIGYFLEKYVHWGTYTPEVDGVLIVYASVYGNTENVANILASKIADAGRKVVVYDVSVTHSSYLIAEAFKYSHIVFVSTTYNAGIFINMENFIHDVVNHNLQNRTIAIVENGSWTPTAGELMKEELSKCENMNFLENTLTVKSSLKENQLDNLNALVEEIVASVPDHSVVAHDGSDVEVNAMFKLSYGLFVLTAKNEKGDNGCIINTVTQLTDIPKRITIAVNKANYTHDMIMETGEFNVSVLSTDVPFSVFQHFGFQSGKDVDKFETWSQAQRSQNGLLYLNEYTNAFLSGKVISSMDFGTHTLFVADVTEAKVLTNDPSVTYAYYFDHVKPKPLNLEKKEGFICKTCGYVYEGDELPEDFICPLCKHGADDFERL